MCGPQAIELITVAKFLYSAGRWNLKTKPSDKVYSMRWYPFMNNTACQICFI